MRNKIRGFVVLAVASVMAAAGSGAQAQEPTVATQKTGGEAVGATIVHPEQWTVEREPYTLEKTYGYTLWRPDTGEVHDHGGMPALRVALAYDLDPEDIDARVRDITADLSNLPVKRQTVDVARGHEGVAVGTIPGSSPSTEVYVPVNDRVYRIDVYAAEQGQEGLGEADRKLLKALRFDAPTRSVSSLDVPAANAPEELYAAGDPKLLQREESARHEALAESTPARAASSKGESYPEQRIYEGCWLANSDFFFQTQHGKYANKGRYGNRRPGWTRIGQPNFWGQYTHGNLNYGRCNEPDWTNDKFAIDYPLRRNDVLFSPFKRGTVTFAGRNTSHKNYGIFVVIRADNGKYVSMSAHLNGLARGIKRGARVTDSTIIGYAGDSGDPTIPVGPVHLHQAFYRHPEFRNDGSPYGGAGLQALFHHYVGTAAGTRPGTYKFGWSHTRSQLSKGDFISN